MNHLEDAECKALWEWAQLYPILRDCLFHVPNGGKRNAREAARMKGMGVRAGVHDYLLPVPRGAFHGLWIEMKAGKNSATPAQKEWRARMQAQGYAAYIVYGWTQARHVIRWYLSLAVPDTDFHHPELTAILAGDQ